VEKYKFDCGCEFAIESPTIKEIDGLPSLLIDFSSINHNCPKTWEVFHSGMTKGIFQLENKLGQDWSKKIKPSNLDELSAVISVIRPGTLKSKLNGTSLTQHFADRKNGSESTEYIHESLKPILASTYGILVYQEQAMRIAVDLAGFDLKEADSLRRAISKKNAELMTQVEELFIKKTKELKVVDEENAKLVFSWIRESQKYSFNKSHGVGYSEIGYWCAYMKAHFPIHFYTSWLYYAKDKQFSQEEVELLIEDAFKAGINVLPPTIKYGNDVDLSHFFTKNGNIYFGVADIKKIGDSLAKKLSVAIGNGEQELGKKIGDWSWYEFLVFIGDEISSSAMNNLIAVGGVDYLDCGMSRNGKLFQYNVYNQLDTKEKQYIKYIGVSSLEDAILKILNDTLLKRTVNRRKKLGDLLHSLRDAPYSTKDTRYQIIKAEQELLGVPVSCSRTDECSVSGESMCVDIPFKKGKTTIAVEILSIREHIIKSGASKGKKMAFLKVKDSSGTSDDVVIFSEKYEEAAALITKGNTLLLGGVISNKNNKVSFVVNEVTQI
jgi:DNA polymerase-3 subunit alpha